MIGRLHGIVAEIGDEEALIDVGGVGYVVRCGSRTLSRLPPLGDEATLHIESQWADQTGLRLYGFLTREDRRAFVLLQAIQGVGPKAALSVLDVLSPSELAQAAARGDRAAVSRANGVGPKLAIRIVTELKDKALGDGLVISAGHQLHAEAPPPPTASGEAVAALMGLDIPESQARRLVEQAMIRFGEEAEVSVLVRAALQEFGR